ncbi:hypothetical protein S245_024369, partial [Arachis hypogaea]
LKTFQDKLNESAHKVLTDYQAATVTLIAIISCTWMHEQQKSIIINRALIKRVKQDIKA